MEAFRTLGLIATLALFVACSGKGENTTPASEGESAKTTSRRAGYEDSSDDDDRKGWRWRGKRNECFFKHGSRCFSKLETACKAAKCKAGKCGHDSSAPANVSCKK